MGSEAQGHAGSGSPHRMQCPFCNAYDVGRIYLASVDADACECASCGARWDEQRGSGHERRGSEQSSILVPREP